jgi:hypothetical protein
MWRRATSRWAAGHAPSPASPLRLAVIIVEGCRLAPLLRSAASWCQRMDLACRAAPAQLTAAGWLGVRLLCAGVGVPPALRVRRPAVAAGVCAGAHGAVPVPGSHGR